MLRLTEVTEENWLRIAALSVAEEQKRFVAPAVGILARAYVYRGCNARVYAIESDGEPIGAALVREFDEEPLGYDLQQFFIDERWQGRGYGSLALGLILNELRKERRFDHVEVCVKKDDAAAIRLYGKHGFVDSGYIDESVPDCINMICLLQQDKARQSSAKQAGSSEDTNMITVYSSPLCPDCRECKANFEAHGIPMSLVDITAGMPALKEFLRLRDGSPVFDVCRENGSVGIPAIIRADGSVTLDWEGFLSELGLPVVYREEHPACSIDGTGC